MVPFADIRAEKVEGGYLRANMTVIMRADWKQIRADCRPERDHLGPKRTAGAWEGLFWA